MIEFLMMDSDRVFPWKRWKWHVTFKSKHITYHHPIPSHHIPSFDPDSGAFGNPIPFRHIDMYILSQCWLGWIRMRKPGILSAPPHSASIRKHPLNSISFHASKSELDGICANQFQIEIFISTKHRKRYANHSHNNH